MADLVRAVADKATTGEIYLDIHPESIGPTMALSFASDVPGTWRVDLLVTGHDRNSGGSTTLALDVLEPVYYGSLLFIESE